MNAVGIVSIVLGVLVVFGRGFLALAPGATLRWFQRLISSDGRMRTAGTFFVALGAVLVWAGSSEDSALAGVLSVVGWAFVAGSTLLLVLFPGAYRALASEFLPSDPSGRLVGWRVRGLVGVTVGVLFIYFGVLALGPASSIG